MIPDVLVAGGGCAGLAAACDLAARGARVEILEARAGLGGRARSWVDPAIGEVEDNGQHVVMGCYEAFLAFAERIGSRGEVAFPGRPEVVLLEPGGARHAFRPRALPAPFDLLGGLLGLRGFPWRALSGAAALARDVRGGRLPEGTAAAWLDRRGQAGAPRRLLWDPLVLAALNLPSEQGPASLLAPVLRRALLGGPAAARIGWAPRGLSRLIGEPAARYLAARGARVTPGAPVAGVDCAGGRAAALRMRDGARREAGRFVLAVPHAEAAALLPELAPVAALGSSPIVGIHLWLEPKPEVPPMVGLLDSTVQWVFDRGRHLALVISGAGGAAARSREDLLAEGLAEVRRFVPAARGARLVRGRVVKERTATPLLTPETVGLRPGTRTSLPNLVLAGDWIDTGLPATLEAAALSGHRAAEALAG